MGDDHQVAKGCLFKSGLHSSPRSMSEIVPSDGRSGDGSNKILHGRQERLARPEDAARAERGELVGLDWKGGVRKKLKTKRARGALRYSATWQGLRGEDLDIDLDAETLVVCSRFGQTVAFSAAIIAEPEEE
jgi:hypothetical protein